MRNRKTQTARLIHAMSLAALAVWLLPCAASGQGFTSIDDALLRKADSLLAAPGNSGPATGETVARTANLSASLHAFPAVLPSSNNLKMSIGHARLEELRPFVAPILQQEGVPAELAAIILVESGGNPAALSPKGARGLWQLMPETARRYGLAVDASHDERLNVERSTRAAARYLGDLYTQFGSWPLALAAYNTGEQNVQRAIDKGRSSDFNVLSSSGLLPLETRNYVPAVLAGTYLSGWQLNLNHVRRAPVSSIVFTLNSN